MFKPKISVLMSVYNGESYLEEAIESILNQTYQNFEFIIVDDASNDGSLSIIKNYSDERIKVIQNQDNIGLTRSLNNGLKSAKGEYIARQDADDISLKNRFEKQMDCLKEHPDVVLLGTSYYTIDEFGNKLGKRLRLKNPTFDDMMRANTFTHGSVIFKKDRICELGGYNPIFKYRQDYFLWLKVIKTFKAMNLTEPLYVSRLHPGTIGSKSTEKAELYAILAKKLINGELDQDFLKNVEKKGILHIYSILTEKEKSEIKNSIDKESDFVQFIRGVPKNSGKAYEVLNPLSYVEFMQKKGLFDPYLKRSIIKLYYLKSNFMTTIRNLK